MFKWFWTIFSLGAPDLPTDSSRPLTFKQIEIFSIYILTVWLYISTVSTFLNIRASYWSASSGFRLLGETILLIAGAINFEIKEKLIIWFAKSET